MQTTQDGTIGQSNLLSNLHDSTGTSTGILSGLRTSRTKAMKTSEEIQTLIESRISNVYKHPKLFGADAEGVMIVLLCYHDIWSEVANRQSDYQSALKSVLEEECCRPYYFSTHYKERLMQAAGGSEDTAIAYVICQWKKVDARLCDTRSDDVPAVVEG